ncbi:MAG TPA: SDR family oxidoreductase [Vicinamibacterales bacterium]
MGKRTALVTGASGGIGAALARVFAANGFDLVLTARRTDRLQSLAEELRAAHGCSVHVIAADLADPGAPARIFDETTRLGLTIDALVNDAGYGLPGGFLHSTWGQHRDFIQVMVTAVAELCYRFAPAMVARQRGWIINVGSVAGLVPGSAGHTLYGAVKSLVIRFSQSLALELRAQGVNVTALCPGFTYSEFHDANGMRGEVSQLPKWMWMDADTVAKQAYDAVVRGDIVCINGRVNRATVLLARYAPDWLVNQVLKRVAKKFRRV